MDNRASEEMEAESTRVGSEPRQGFPLKETTLSWVVFGVVAVAIVVRLAAGPGIDWLLICASVAAGAHILLAAISDRTRNRADTEEASAPELKDVSESAGPSVSPESGERNRDPFKSPSSTISALRQQEILLNSVADGICGVDRDGLVTFVNPAAARLLGASAAILTGKPVHELLHGPAESRKCGDHCPLEWAKSGFLSSTGQDVILRANGTSFPAEYFLNPIFEQDCFSGSVLSFRDISQRSAVDRVKDEFISTVSHELRTPLTSIRGALGLLSSGVLGMMDAKAQNLLRIAQTNSDRLAHLINDILDLERMQSGRESLNLAPVDLVEVVRQATDAMQPLAQAAGVRLVRDNARVEVLADRDRLLQVLTNLLSNAIKFSPSDSTVSVMIQAGETGVTLSVIDQGRGIPAEKLETIFHRFQQVDVSDSRQKGGTGLGLAICRTIVAQHRGRIWAERNPVRGSTFRLFLPCRLATAKASGKGRNGHSQATVLLADLNGIPRPLIAGQLAGHGYHVVETATVEQTLATARSGAEAILLDPSLGGTNGWDLLPLLRQTTSETRSPIVLLKMANQDGAAETVTGLEQEDTWPADSSQMQEMARLLSSPGEKARVLIVEHDRELAELIRNVFAGDSIEVRLAYSRQQALEACLAFIPNLIVLNIGLPDGDGFKLVDGLRKQESLVTLPLLVYSGRELTSHDRRQLTLGPTHFLSKATVQPQQLETLVLTILRSPQLPDEAITAEPVGASR